MNHKVPLREKIAYGLGDAGCNFVWTTVGSFLTLYYTDSVGLTAAAVGTLMLISRLLDGASDIAMGVIIDKTNTRWGKARPWILISSLPLAIGLILLFNVPAGLDGSGKLIYAYITYIFLAAIAYTACNLSYCTLLSLAATQQKDRTLMSTIRFICTMTAVVIIVYCTMNLVDRIGWMGMSVTYGVIAFILLLITFFGTKERYVPIKSQAEARLSLKASVKALLKNKYFVFVAMLFILNYAAMGLSNGSGIYYARDVLGDIGIFGTLSVMGFIPSFFGLPLFPAIVNKIGKWKAMMGGYAMIVLGSIMMLIWPENITLIMVGLFMRGIGMVPQSAGLFALVADVSDYGEWKTGERIDGLTFSATSFGMKVGTGLGSALVGWLLAWGNYNAAAVVQGEPALLAMKAMYIYVPLILFLIAAVVLYFTNIDKIYPEMMKDLEQRRKDHNK